jgi:hypothetical protein
VDQTQRLPGGLHGSVWTGSIPAAFSGGMSAFNDRPYGATWRGFPLRAPEYVLLTHAYYRRITEDQQDDFDQEEFIEHLWTGG